MGIENQPSEHPVGDKVDKLIEKQVEEKVEESNIQRMERLAKRQGEMYNDIKNKRRRDTIYFLIIVGLLFAGLIRQTERTDDICNAALANRSILHDVVEVAYNSERQPIDLSKLSGFDQIQDQGVITWINSLSILFSTSSSNGVPKEIQQALNRKVC